MGSESDSEEVVRNECEHEKERGRQGGKSKNTTCEKKLNLPPLPCQEDLK